MNPFYLDCHRIALFTHNGSDVSVVLDLMIHDIDLILSIVKKKIISISANGACLVSNQIDIANATITFENGTIAVITASRISSQCSRKSIIFQKSGYYSIDFKKKKAIFINESLKNLQNKNYNEEYVSMQKMDIQKIDASDQTIDSLTHELESFINVVEADIKPVVDGATNIKTLEVAQKIVEIITKDNFI